MKNRIMSHWFCALLDENNGNFMNSIYSCISGGDEDSV